jgi:dephospho-CoA kinase
LFGLTGGTASGKSTVAAYFGELGAELINADAIGHELLQRPGPARAEVVRRFGPQILGASGEIDRKRLAAIVFGDPARRAELDAVMHPLIMARVEEEAIALKRNRPNTIILVEAALIYEAGVEGRFHKVLVAWCRADQQIARLMAKTGLAREEAEARIATQMSSEEKLRRADFVIDCSGTMEEMRRQVRVLYPLLEQAIGQEHESLGGVL